MKDWKAAAGLVLVTIIWGGGFVASDIALDSLTPLQIMSIRFLSAAVCMGLMALPSGIVFKKEAFIRGARMGLALFSGFALQTLGLQYTTPSKNAFLTSVNVVLVPLLAWMLLKKRMPLKALLGALLSLLGVGILSLNGSLLLGLGDVLTLAGAVGFAFHIFLTGQYAGQYPVRILNFFQMAVAALLSVICLFLFRETDFTFHMEGVAMTLYLGLMSTTLCYILQTACQRYVDAAKSAILLSMEVVFGTLFSVLLLGEKISFRMALGSGVILSAVILSNLSETKKEEPVKLFSPRLKGLRPARR